MSFVELVSFKMEWPKYMLLFVVFLANVYGVAFDVKGVIPAVVTPFKKNYDVNYDYIPEYAKNLSSTGADGILVGAIAPEVPVLTLGERKNLLDAWVKAARPLNLSVTHEVGGLPMADVLELAKYSESLGVDALMIKPNKDNMPTDVNSLVKYVSEVAQAAPTLQILYHHPRWLTNLNIVDIVRQLKDQNKNFLGILGSLENAKNVADLIRDKDHIFIDNHEEKANACKSGFFSNMDELTGIDPKSMKRMNELGILSNYFGLEGSQRRINDYFNSYKESGAISDEWTGWIRYANYSYSDFDGQKLGHQRQYLRDPLTTTTTEKNNLPTDKPQTSTVTTTTTEKNNLPTEKPQTSTVTTTTTEKNNLPTEKPQTSTVTTTTTEKNNLPTEKPQTSTVTTTTTEKNNLPTEKPQTSTVTSTTTEKNNLPTEKPQTSTVTITTTEKNNLPTEKPQTSTVTTTTEKNNLPTEKPQTSTVTTTTTEKNNLTTKKPQTTTVTTTTTTEKKKLLVDKLMKVDLKGKRLTPVFTPFKQNGDVNLGIIPAYANYLYKQNITTIWIFSTAGESFSVNLCERKSIINVWVNINKKRNYGFVIFVGTGFLTATESCNFASYCQSLNVTAIVYKTMTDGSPVNSLQAMREINSIAQCAPSTPIFYYNDENYILCGGTRNVSVSLVVKVAAAQIPSFGGLISTLEDAILSHEYNPTIQHIGFYFYQIPDSTFSILQLDALATPFANLFPKAILAIDNAQSADEAIIQHDQFSKLAAPLCQLRPECRLFCALNILKLSMKKITGINTGSPRRPLCQIARRDDIDTEKILKSLGYL